MIRFEIGGRTVSPNNIKDELMRAVLKGMKEQIHEQVGAIRDPKTGEFPTVVVRGNDMENLKIHVEGSPEVIALVQDRLGMDTENEDDEKVNSAEMPKVFLPYTSGDIDLA